MPDAAASDGAGGIDWSHLMDQFDGELAVVCEIVEAYACETRENVERLPEKLASGDAEELRRQAHTLGGTMRMFRVTAAEQLARELEAIAKTGSLEGAGRLVDALLRAANEVLPALDHFVASGGGPVRGRS